MDRLEGKVEEERTRARIVRVDRVSDSELLAQKASALLGRAGRGDHGAAFELGDLDGRLADAALAQALHEGDHEQHAQLKLRARSQHVAPLSPLDGGRERQQGLEILNRAFPVICILTAKASTMIEGLHALFGSQGAARQQIREKRFGLKGIRFG